MFRLPGVKKVVDKIKKVMMQPDTSKYRVVHKGASRADRRAHMKQMKGKYRDAIMKRRRLLAKKLRIPYQGPKRLRWPKMLDRGIETIAAHDRRVTNRLA